MSEPTNGLTPEGGPWITTPLPDIICPGTGEFVDDGQVNGSFVTHCPVCDATTLAEPVPSPEDVETAYWAVRLHEPRVHPELGVHGPGCPVFTEHVCTCTGRRR